ncbi:Crp/Fnr family transcriptional regulator [Labrys wisconsinensis]|uniref:Cyclic nucleotide-binding domain-containing protein n=1 Tax=Labrys wisconsinensis TaxID=425677 RepID=A0ABU0JB03_9HYPH|nr:cyclic nucleotide-binding domain-containing protein [Labrys wisconsinensis]MDQ0470716.1 hypothetical protein [Labrys wisconsinensis]
MLESFLQNGLVHVAALIGVAAMTFRSQLLLRGLLLASTMLYIVYYLAVPPVPMWAPIFWSAVTVAINGTMMARIVLDRTQFRLTLDEQRLQAELGDTLSPGAFRRLMALASWRTAESPRILTREGAPVESLFYVVDGALGITKSGKSFPIAAGTFIGEVAFLRGTPASATATLQPGARYVEWPAAALGRLLDGNPSLRTAFGSLLNEDMAAKVANA